MSAPVPAPEDGQIRILSLNVWGLAFVSKDRSTRIRAIADHLASAPYDIVCLQEIWLREEFEIIRNEVLQSLPFTRFFRTGAIGSGLAILSRYPFISTRAMPYNLSGCPHQVIAGDFYVNKAAVAAVILHPALGEVEVWNTHMHAGGDYPNTKQAHRMTQSWQLANAINGSVARGRFVFVMGDFNSQPFSIPIAILRSHSQLRDSYLDMHPQANDVVPTNPKIALSTYGMTCDSPLNTYSHGKPIPQEITAQGGKRLDYIFYREPEICNGTELRSSIVGAFDAGIGSSGSSWPPERKRRVEPRIRCVKSEVVLTELVPGTNFSYSDHFGIASTFAINLPDALLLRSSTEMANAYSDSKTTSKNHVSPLIAINTDGDALTAVSPSAASTLFAPFDPKFTGSTTTTTTTTTIPSTSDINLVHTSPNTINKVATIRSALTTIRDYSRLANKQAKAHLRFMYLTMFFLSVFTVGSAWQPKSWIQPIFTLIAAGLGGLGATFLYTGFIWGKWEQGYLSETIDEMELELTVMEMNSTARIS